MSRLTTSRHPNSERAQGNVVTRSFGAAVFIHALGQRVLRVHSHDGSTFGAHWVFPPSARPALEAYYAARDSLNALGAQYLTNSEEVHPDGVTRHHQ